MSRFFVEPSQIKKGFVTITGADVVHIRRVLRLGIGDTMTVLDGQGTAYKTRIAGMGKDSIHCEITKEYDAGGEPPVRVTLVQGLPKGDKMELIIQKGTELGVTTIIPAACRRSVVQLNPAKARDRRERWQRVALEAAKQCRRAIVPTVTEVKDLAGALRSISENALALIPWEEENTSTLKDVLRNHCSASGSSDVSEVVVFIGPEGGFEPSEISLAQEHNVKPVTLGPRILRTETAGLAALTMILYELGDLGS